MASKSSLSTPHTSRVKRDCEDARSDGLLHLISLLKSLKQTSDYILLENVEGFETSQSRELLLEVLKNQQYSVQEFILSPNQFQIPNQRDRYFLIARKKAFPIPPEDIPRLGPCYRIIPFHPTCVNITYKSGTAEMGTKESHDLWNSLNTKCKPLSEFLGFTHAIRNRSYSLLGEAVCSSKVRSSFRHCNSE